LLLSLFFIIWLVGTYLCGNAWGLTVCLLGQKSPIWVSVWVGMVWCDHNMCGVATPVPQYPPYTSQVGLGTPPHHRMLTYSGPWGLTLCLLGQKSPIWVSVWVGMVWCDQNMCGIAILVSQYPPPYTSQVGLGTPPQPCMLTY
jgi:hypothetical protein